MKSNKTIKEIKEDYGGVWGEDYAYNLRLNFNSTTPN